MSRIRVVTIDKKGRKVLVRKRPARPRAESLRDDQYAKVSREAIKHGETDQLVRHLMAAGLADGRSSSKVLASDLTLLRWVLGKMEDNRRASELEQEFDKAPE